MKAEKEAAADAGRPARTGEGTGAEPEAKLACRGVWKIFGDGAEDTLARHGGHMDDEALKQAGLVGAVRDVNLEIAAGEIFIIMGLSGSGKSTLVRCMSRLIPITGGQMLVESRDLKTMSERDLLELRRHKMGMVFQHFALLPHLTVLANVAFPLEIQGGDRQSREHKAREIIKLVGLEGREHNYPRQLSGSTTSARAMPTRCCWPPESWLG
jgi:glycine betaine/proline transport system ATP-binding protein